MTRIKLGTKEDLRRRVNTPEWEEAWLLWFANIGCRKGRTWHPNQTPFVDPRDR